MTCHWKDMQWRNMSAWPAGAYVGLVLVSMIVCASVFYACFVGMEWHAFLNLRGALYMLRERSAETIKEIKVMNVRTEKLMSQGMPKVEMPADRPTMNAVAVGAKLSQFSAASGVSIQHVKFLKNQCWQIMIRGKYFQILNFLQKIVSSSSMLLGVNFSIYPVTKSESLEMNLNVVIPSLMVANTLAKNMIQNNLILNDDASLPRAPHQNRKAVHADLSAGTAVNCNPFTMMHCVDGKVPSSPLTLLPLSAYKRVGTFVIKNQNFALISAPNHQVYVVGAGSRIGNQGERVVAVTPFEVRVTH